MGPSEEHPHVPVARSDVLEAAAPSRPALAPRLVSGAVELARGEPAAFFALFVVGIVLFAPGSAFTLAAGLAYGLWLGLIVSVAASTVAAVIHFAAARHLFRGSVRTRLEGRRRFEALDRAVSREGWKIVGLTRISALIPGAVQSCLYAFTGIPFRTFLLASFVGLVPPTLVFALMGSTGAHLLSMHGAAPGIPHLAVRLGSLIALGVAVRHVSRMARQELARAA